MKFRKKPVVIEALQWNGENLFEIITFIDGKPDLSNSTAADRWDTLCKLVDRDGFKIKTLEGWMDATIGDWIIKGVQGEFYPCKPDIFEATYERVEVKELELIMSKELTLHEAGIQLALAIVLYPLLCVWQGYVIATLWGWFVVPLGIAAIGTAQGFGASLLVTTLIGRRPPSHKEESARERYWIGMGFIVLQPLFALAIGALVHNCF